MSGTLRQAVSIAKRGNLGCSPQGLVTAFGLVKAGWGERFICTFQNELLLSHEEER